ncbi:MAG: DUF1573 domain-containing protein [candidate division Zixibacteria bacterium]|nr:DUF1573 domain-containing protein [candidate division Zixibacteria bacterium]NIR65417.1 DUF1573 domain-containing protein [candidate division Zixibacteria bacterium]NIS15238.1 DUF1573 domain-containing protein [candidate division Zixibacteria bacterium]NIS45776.1 DUF1573 domain-containing protein [candidate division Zixibacteria bacterium]NIT51768.1 DUF1573 domain-containing protein [candidate division Zixibacteria bacterium]
MNNIKTIIITTLTILFIGSSGLFAQGQTADIFLPDSIFDFGFFATDARVVHTYPIVNQGSDTLRITKVKPGCGCTIAPLDKHNIAPGDTAYLDLYFDSKRLTGLVKKGVTILSNDPDEPLREVSIISITGKQHPYVQPKPAVINFGRMSMDKLDSEFTVSLTNVTDAPVELEIVDYSRDFIEVELDKDSLTVGEAGTCIVTLKRIPNDPRFYNFSATLSVNIEDVRIHLTIPAVGRINRVD